MKKYVLASVIVGVIFSLCFIKIIDMNLNDKIQEYVFKDNVQYNKYLSIKQENNENIDVNGYYYTNDIAQYEMEIPEDSIHVAFAKSNLINVAYYKDEECTDLIDNNNCYLYPGDKIYTKVDLTSLVQSNTYSFNGFQIAAFDGESANYNYKKLDGNVITIPNDIQYSEISIIPLGSYKERELNFQSYYKDENNQLHEISINWEINYNKQQYVTQSNNYKIKATKSFEVIGKYDPEKYYLIENEVEPKFLSHSANSGVVKFSQNDTKNAINDYKIVLGKNIEAIINSITSTGDITIYINGQKQENVEFPFKFYAKAGTECIIKSDGEIQNVDCTESLSRINKEDYVYFVCDENKTFDFNPSEYTYSNGKVTFYYNNKEITETISLCIGDKIECLGKSDEGYQFNEGNEKVQIEINSNTAHLLKNELKFVKTQKIELPQPEEGGTITYYINDKEVKESFVDLTPYTDKLTATFEPSKGFKVKDISDGAECVGITENNHRIKFKNNNGEPVTIDDIFVSIKANLSVELDKSIDTEIKFSIYNGSDLINTEKKSYVKKDAFKDLKNIIGIDDNVIIDNCKIDTTSNIKVAISDWDKLNNEAIRIDVKKTNNSKQESNEIYYITSGSGYQIISTNLNDIVNYTDIEIQISKVQGSYFKSQDYTYKNANVVFYYSDISSKAPIQDGSFVDNSRDICMTVIANQNYILYQKSKIPFSKKFDVVDKYEVNFKYNKIIEKFSDMKTKINIE